jgi:hypothetical protein
MRSLKSENPRFIRGPFRRILRHAAILFAKYIPLWIPLAAGIRNHRVRVRTLHEVLPYQSTWRPRVKSESSEAPMGLDRPATSEEIKDAVLLSDRAMEYTDKSLWKMISQSEYYAAVPSDQCDRLVLVERLSNLAN